ncbi:MAG TPA: L-lactate dehydrogenase [Firmicutes bacterium]|nr:L-lactate dehydrogenase [Bacillota bacterium]
MSKIVIIGAGFVGSTIAYALMIGGTAQEIVLIDKIKEKARGEAMDLNHGASFVKPINIYAGDYSDCREADIIIITAGVSQRPGQTRLDLVETNTAIMKEIISRIMEYNTEAILIIVANPVDIISYVAWKSSDLPHSKVIGSGTVLDTSRFRHLLSVRCGIDPRNVHAYVIGEHGDSELPLWSTANIGGIPLERFCEDCTRACSSHIREEVSQGVREAAYEIIEGKGATYYAIALAVRRITESILRDEHSVLTVSAYINNIYGIKDIYLSVPCILGKQGVEKIIPFKLDETEKKLFFQTADIIKKSLPSDLLQPSLQLT